MTEQGCHHREHEHTAPCNKLCEPGHTLCPYHQLLADFEADRKEQRERQHRAEAEHAKVSNRRR
jgi:hypothetical protein